MSRWDLPPLTEAELEARRQEEPAEAPGGSDEALLASLRIDTASAERPAVSALVARDDGRPVLVRSIRHLLFGPPGAGKSLLALVAAKAAIEAGGAVVWLDWESPPWRTRWRWDHLGLAEAVGRAPAAWHQYRVPELIEPENRPALRALLEAIAALTAGGAPVLTVVDSASAAGVPRDTGEAVAPWWGILANVWMEAGATVLVIDHSPHADASRPVGSGDKTAQVDLSLQATGGPCWSPEADGEIRLRVAKDRDGLVGQAGDALATFRGTWASRRSEALDMDVREFALAIEAPEGGLPVPERVLEHLAATPGEFRTGRQIEAAVTGSGQAIRDALRQLVEAGRLVSAPAARGGTGYAVPARARP